MKVAQITFVLIACVYTVSAEFTCDLPQAYSDDAVKPKWQTMGENAECVRLMKAQVDHELEAAMTYLAMGAHFSRDIINRPGFAKMFFESANEEREHAIKIIDYLLMRGELVKDINELINNPFPKHTDVQIWKNGFHALHDALKLEVSVTKYITAIVEACEGGKGAEDKSANDFHLVDYLSGEFLEEQYKGQRDLAGKLSILKKMEQSNGQLGEFLFDKKLLNGELPTFN